MPALYGNLSYYVLTNSTQTTTIPQVYLAAGIVNGAAALYYYYYDFRLYNQTIADIGMCYAQINGTYGFIWDGAKYAACIGAATNIPPSIIYNFLNSYFITPTQASNLYGGIYTLPSSNNIGPYWTYVGYYTTLGGGSVSDLVLDFMAHSYTNTSYRGQDSITTLRFKAGSSPPAGSTFYGNGQAYYIGCLLYTSPSPRD